MSRVAQVLGVARSNLHERAHGRSRPRGSYRKAEDAELLPLIRRVVDERPTDGYRRVTALVNRELRRQGAAPANHKRIYRIMKRHALLLQRPSGRREGRVHDGRIVVMRSNRRPPMSPDIGSFGDGWRGLLARHGAPMCWSSPAGTARSS
jgi:hypothetical protein